MYTKDNDTDQPTDSNKWPTLLLVDDDLINIKLLEAILKKEKFNILTADNGEDAIAITKTRLPDALILDIMMPLMNGFEVTRRIKGDPKTAKIPVILLTAFDSEEQRKLGLECGAEEFLTKPISSIELLSQINETLRLRPHQE